MMSVAHALRSGSGSSTLHSVSGSRSTITISVSSTLAGLVPVPAPGLPSPSSPAESGNHQPSFDEVYYTCRDTDRGKGLAIFRDRTGGLGYRYCSKSDGSGTWKLANLLYVHWAIQRLDSDHSRSLEEPWKRLLNNLVSNGCNLSTAY